MSNDFTKTAAHALDSAVSRAVQSLITPAKPSGNQWNLRVQELRAVREKTISTLLNLNQAQADFAPAAGTWSIAQNADHILLSEQLYRTQLRNLMELARKGGKTTLEIGYGDVNPAFPFIPREVLSLLATPLTIMNMFMPAVVRQAIIRYPLIPALAPSVMEPAKSRPIDDLRASMRSSFAVTEELFRDRVPANLGSMSVSHPLLGNNTVAQIFGLMCAHEERHRAQIEKISRLAHFPKQQPVIFSQTPGHAAQAPPPVPDSAHAGTSTAPGKPASSPG